MALEEETPQLKRFTPQAFIKSMQEAQKIKLGKDQPCIFEDFQIKISELQLVLVDYIIAAKQFKIKIFLPNYDEIKHFENIHFNVKTVVMEIIRRTRFQKTHSTYKI